LQPLLNLTAIEKRFGGVRALRGVSLELQRGEIHALIGENGAGKSTLIKIITGALQPDAGEFYLDGHLITENKPSLAHKLGVAAIYQQPALFPDLTVAENIALRLQRESAWQWINWGRRRREARELLDRVGATIDERSAVRELSMPQQQLVEIAAALGAKAKILILDEPTASLSEREVENLFRVLHELRKSDVGLIYVSHRLEELSQMADRVTVLRDGEYVCTKSMAEVNRAELIRLMVGRSVESIFPKITVPIGEVALEMRAVSCAAGGVHDVNLTVRRGEIVGLCGLVGAGRTELGRTLFGLTPADGGEIRVKGQGVKIHSPADAISHGIAYLPEDRRRHGVVLEMSVASNTTLATLRQISTLGLLNFTSERRIAKDFVKRLGTKTPSVDALAGQLSGGNQQKVALSRWLAANPAILILDEPTQGVDVGAKAEIHRLIGELAAGGMAIILISSEMPEILGMADRIAVLRGGTIVRTMDRAGATQEQLLELALGTSTDTSTSGTAA
jgi:rhamnose transport system ATP-binding protein